MEKRYHDRGCVIENCHALERESTCEAVALPYISRHGKAMPVFYSQSASSRAFAEVEEHPKYRLRRCCYNAKQAKSGVEDLILRP